MRTPNTQTLTWTIIEKKAEARDVYTLVLKSGSETSAFTAGQYLTVLLPGHQPAEGKSYSISSTPGHDTLSITVKRMGRFSEELTNKAVGDTLTTSRPYGFFYPEPPYPDTLVFLAGGIGIAPIMSIIETLLTEGYTGNITLFYSNQNVERIAFKKQLDTLTREYARFTTYYFITRETPDSNTLVKGRMTPSFIIEHVPSPNTADYFVCGSTSLTRDLWRMLKGAGIDANHIYTEGFF